VGRAVNWRKQKGHASRRTLNEQSLWGWVSVKLTPEICINIACSSSWLTVGGRWAAPQIAIHKTVSRLHFFFLWWDWNCIAFELGIFFFSLSPLMRQWQNYYSDTNTRTGCWRTSTKSIKTETLLHLNLGNFIYLFISIIILLLFFNPLSVFLMPV
jgi:hypothetical protein